MPPTPVRAFARPWPFVLFASLLLAALAAACGEGEEGPPIPGGPLTDPRTVPTATPWAEPPEPLFLEEGAIAPLEEGPAASGETYVVQAGDTPWSICQKFGCDHNELMALNGITDPTTLRVGQKLKIPRPRE